MEFTQKQKLDIAEFIFAFQTDTLIKAEAEKLIKVFQEHHIPEAYVANLSIEDCLDLLKDHVDEEQGKAIMEEYLSGKL